MEVEASTTVIPPPPPPLLSTVSASRRDDDLPRSVSPTEDDPITAAIKVLRRQMDRICKDDENVAVLSKLCPVEPVLQSGPQCGLVALAMASQLLQPSPVGVARAFETAKALGFTNKGEMFSVENMRLLAESVMCCRSELLHCPADHRGRLIEHLLRGKPILVPYDSDGNFEPCLKGGHTAHWAVIHGFCVAIPAEEMDDVANCCHWEDDVELGRRLRHVRAAPSAQAMAAALADELSVFVYASQGKSRRVGLWDLDCLLRSNGNLAEATRKHDTASEFVLPSGGLVEGLAGKLLLLG